MKLKSSASRRLLSGVLVACLGSAFLVLSSPEAWAQGGKKPSKEMVEEWRKDLDEARSLLAAGDAEKARGQLLLLHQEIVLQRAKGEEVEGLLGDLTVLRAVAAYEMEDEQQAVWYWKVAQQLFPARVEEARKSDMPALAFLRQNESERPGSLPEIEPPEEESDLTPPQKVYSPMPIYPGPEDRATKKVSLVVRTQIGTDGRLSNPQIVESKGLTALVLWALNPVREWQFEPATRDGEPIPVDYQLSLTSGA